MSWSKPYYGASHLADTKPFQVTAEEHNYGAHWWIINPSVSFDNLRSGDAKNIVEAKKAAEEAYALISGKKTPQ